MINYQINRLYVPQNGVIKKQSVIWLCCKNNDVKIKSNKKKEQSLKGTCQVIYAARTTECSWQLLVIVPKHIHILINIYVPSRGTLKLCPQTALNHPFHNKNKIKPCCLWFRSQDSPTKIMTVANHMLLQHTHNISQHSMLF